MFLLVSDMGCQIDGFVAVFGHTHIITNGPVMGRSADVLAAANTAAEVTMRLVASGSKVHPSQNNTVSFIVLCRIIALYAFLLTSSIVVCSMDGTNL